MATTVTLQVTFADDDERAPDRFTALRDHLFETFNDDQSITGIAFVADDGALQPPPTWNATAFDGEDGGAWVCSQCGSTELVDDESHPITRGIDVNKSTADLIAFDGMGECWYEAASGACIECRDCGARMDYPADIGREYV